jgi:hypothetical protein
MHETLIDLIYKNNDTSNYIETALETLGYTSYASYHSNYFASHYGLLLDEQGNVLSIDSKSPYVHVVSIKDQCIKINEFDFLLSSNYEFAIHSLTFKHMMGSYTIAVEPVNAPCYFKKIGVE